MAAPAEEACRSASHRPFGGAAAVAAAGASAAAVAVAVAAAATEAVHLLQQELRRCARHGGPVSGMCG